MATESTRAAQTQPWAGFVRIRASLKRGVELLTSTPPLLKLLKRLRRGNVVILGYHNVVPDSEKVVGEAPLHLPVTLFREHLDMLKSHFDICSLQDALQADQVSQRRRLRVVLTFDDAYRGTLQIAVPELVHRECPATIFAPSGLLGTPSFWWDAYDVSPMERRQTCLINLKGDGERILDWAGERGKPKKPLGPFQRPGTANELLEASTHPKIDVGVHTSSHPNLAELTRDEVVRELEDCLEELRSIGIEPTPYVAYPYGLSSLAARDAVRRGVWAAGLAIEGGSFRPGAQNPWQTPRMSVPSGASSQNLLLRTLGVINT